MMGQKKKAGMRCDDKEKTAKVKQTVQLREIKQILLARKEKIKKILR